MCRSKFGSSRRFTLHWGLRPIEKSPAGTQPICSLFFCSHLPRALVATSALTDEPLSPELSAPNGALTPATSVFRREMERLSARAMSPTEQLLAGRALTNRSVWIDGMRPCAFAQAALALAVGNRQSVLFVSPSQSTWEDRKLRLGTRGPWRSVDRKVRTQIMTSQSVVSVTPDALLSPVVARALGPNGPDLIFVEEAHALSTLSGNFRPSLRNVATWLRRFPRATLLCSATASNAALRTDVALALGKPDLASTDALVQAPLLGDAHSIRLEVDGHGASDPSRRIAQLPRPALVLCGTPAQADQVFAELEAQKVPVHRYHSGLSETARAKELLHFALPGRRAVLVAVSAFGPSSGFEGASAIGVAEDFGRDYLRRDLRSIVHLCAPCSLTQYANELSLLSPTPLAGSGTNGEDSVEGQEESNESPQLDHDVHPDSVASGSDQGPAQAVLFFDSAHLMLNLALLQRKRPTAETLEAILTWMTKRTPQSGPGSWFKKSELVASVGGSRRDIEECLRFLADAGGIEDGPEGVRAGDAGQLQRIGTELARDLSSLRDGDAHRLQEVENYAHATGCRRTTLLGLLGYDQGADCGACDACDPSHGLSQAENATTRGLSDRRRTKASKADRVRAVRMEATSGAVAQRGTPDRPATARSSHRGTGEALPDAGKAERFPIALRPLARAKARS